QAGLRADDPGERELGRTPRRARRRGDLSRAVHRQGQALGASGAARGSGAALLRLDELAAAPLCRSSEPMAAGGGAAGPAAAVWLQLGGTVVRHARFRADLDDLP